MPVFVPLIVHFPFTSNCARGRYESRPFQRRRNAFLPETSWFVISITHRELVVMRKMLTSIWSASEFLPTSFDKAFEHFPPHVHLCKEEGIVSLRDVKAEISSVRKSQTATLTPMAMNNFVMVFKCTKVVADILATSLSAANALIT
mmetsp:Transcript_28615/g.45988  ORF Transcript_28615/g.45988 Transcript_28615/m.45988 type:complete len:146 (+) Transcript_28615:314-751(+)